MSSYNARITHRTSCLRIASGMLIGILFFVFATIISSIAYADEVSELKLGNEADGFYYYTIDKEGNTAKLIAIDLRDVTDSFDGAVVIPDIIATPDGTEYKVTEAAAKCPSEYTDCDGGGSNLTLFLFQTSNGKIAFPAYYNETEEYNPCLSKVKSLMIGVNIERISASSFLNCVNLSSVVYADDCKLQEIGNYAFEGVTSLKSFSTCSCVEEGLFDLTGLKGLTSIGTRNFSGARIETLIVPKSVKTMSNPHGGDATNLSRCFNAKRVVFEAGINLEKIPRFGNSKADGVCSPYLETVEFGEGASAAGFNTNAFAYLPSLKSVDIPNGITETGNNRFIGCNALEVVDLASTVETISRGSFQDCISLKQVIVRHLGALQMNTNNSSHPFALPEGGIPSESLSICFVRGDETADFGDTGTTFDGTWSNFVTKRLDIYGNSELLKAKCEELNGKAKYTENGVTGDVAVVYHEYPDASELGEAIDAAIAAKDAYEISVDGADVYSDTKWLTQADMDALDTAIANAQATLDNLTSSEDEIAAAIPPLNEALAKAKDGTKATARDIEDLIDAIDAVTTDSADAIASARAKFDALSDERKAAAANVEVKILKAEAELAKLQAAEEQAQAVAAAKAEAEKAVAQAACDAAGIAYDESKSAADNIAAATAAAAEKAAADAKAAAEKAASAVSNGSLHVVGKAIYKVVDADAKTVSLYKSIAAGKKATVPASAKIDGVTYAVVGIGAKAFAGTKVKTVTVKTAKLTKKSVKGSLKGSAVKTVKVPKAKKAAYKKIFTKKVAGKKVKVK